MCDEKLYELLCDLVLLIELGSPAVLRGVRKNGQEILIKLDFKETRKLALVHEDGPSPLPSDSHQKLRRSR